MSPMCTRSCWLALALLPALAHAEDPVITASDWGNAGLLQTPSARMHPAGEVSLSYSRTEPYSRFNVMLQPFDWLEAGFRYMDVSNRLYGPTIAGNQSYKDKSIDAKVRLWPETRALPQVAVGMRDIGGTGLFAGEYVVASKRVADLDFSLGLGWGYLGARGDFSNPLSVVSDKFDQRPSDNAQAGSFNANSYFRGRTALFGGVQYQTPLQPLLLKLEYEGNDYQSEPQQNNQKQDSPLNVGLVWRVTPGVHLQAALERGNTAMLGVSFHANLARTPPVPKVSDPAPLPLRPASQPAGGDWAQAARQLEANAGWQVQRIRQRGPELIIEAEQTRYRDVPEAMDRTARIVHHEAPDDVAWITVASERRDLRVTDWSVQRQAWLAEQARIDGEPANERLYQSSAPAWVRARTLFEAPRKPFKGGMSVGYRQSLGGPDGFLLYQLSLDASGEWRPRDDLWLAGGASVRAFDNYDDFKYTGPSKLPRVRTFLREYLTTTRTTLPNLQVTKTWQPATDVFAMTYGGLLESMYGGVGVEWLYRPHGERWSVGADLNVVRQRDFRQDFSFRDYRTTTGHVTGYFDTRVHGIWAKLQVGRYLAGDKGATLELARQFRNGVTMGAYATLTDVSREEFGEGSFDKGIYVNLPFDLMLTRSTRANASIVWSPLTRDGGARLARRYTLFDLTADRDLDPAGLPDR